MSDIARTCFQNSNEPVDDSWPEYDRIVDQLRTAGWWHWTAGGMCSGGWSSDPKYKPYVAWSDIQKIIDGTYEPDE